MAQATMRLPVARLLLSAIALLAVVPATAGAATAPKVTSVAPLKLKIGERLTIRGSGFLPGKNRTTVVFKATGTRAVFAKAESATKTKLVVKVPGKLLSFLKVNSGGATVATRFQIRVLGRRFSPSYTPAGKSPVIAAATTAADPAPATPVTTGSKTSAAASTAPAASGGSTTPTTAASDCDHDGTPDSVDTDDDNDLLLDTIERNIGTDPCNADSDSDGMTDGWEYKSALDLYNQSCRVDLGDYPTPCQTVAPSTSTRVYPNPLSADAGSDYDGDNLTAIEEFTAWQRKASLDPAWRTLTDLWYSAGKPASQDTSAAGDGCVGMAVPLPFDGRTDLPKFDWGPHGTPPVLTAPEYQAYSLDRVGRHGHDGCLDDSERDEDGDYLTNFDETHGAFSTPDWWLGAYDQEHPYSETYTGTNWLVADSDNNGVIDGLDDADHDDFLNVEEVTRGPMSHTASTNFLSRAGLWVEPFNPCLPSVESRSCKTTLLLDMAAWTPFKKKGSDPNPVDRWPLYPMKSATSAYYGYLPYTEPGETPEVWDSQTYANDLPPLHPLPRPGLG